MRIFVKSKALPMLRIISRSVPETLTQVDASEVAFLSMDMNCAAPEIAAAEFFWRKMTPGGVILLDDYGHILHQEQKQAFEHFAAERGTTVLSLPTGQGLI